MNIKSTVDPLMSSPSYENKIDTDSNGSPSRKSSKFSNTDRLTKQEKPYFEKTFKKKNQNDPSSYTQNIEGKAWDNEKYYNRAKDKKKKNGKRPYEQSEDFAQMRNDFNSQPTNEGYINNVNNSKNNSSSKITLLQKNGHKSENLGQNLGMNEAEKFQAINTQGNNGLIGGTGYINTQPYIQSNMMQKGLANSNIMNIQNTSLVGNPQPNNGFQKKKFNNGNPLNNTGIMGNYENKNPNVGNFHNMQYPFNQNMINYPNNFNMMNQNFNTLPVNQNFHNQINEHQHSLFKQYEKNENQVQTVKKEEKVKEDTIEAPHIEIVNQAKFHEEHSETPNNFKNGTPQTDWKNNNNVQMYVNINNPDQQFVFQHNILNNNSFVNIQQQQVFKNMPPFQANNQAFRPNMNFNNGETNNLLNYPPNFPQNPNFQFPDMTQNWEHKKLNHQQHSTFYKQNQGNKPNNYKFKGNLMNNQMPQSQMSYAGVNNSINMNMNKSQLNNFNNNPNRKQINQKQGQQGYYGNFIPNNIQRPNMNYTNYNTSFDPNFNQIPFPNDIRNSNNSNGSFKINGQGFKKHGSERGLYHYNQNTRSPVHDQDFKDDSTLENEEESLNENIKDDRNFKERKHSNNNLINPNALDQKNKYKIQNKFNLQNSYSENFGNSKKSESSNKLFNLNQNLPLNFQRIYQKTHSFNSNIVNSKTHQDSNSSYFDSPNMSPNQNAVIFSLNLKFEGGFKTLEIKQNENIELTIKNFCISNRFDIALFRGIYNKVTQALEIWRDLQMREIPSYLENLIEYSFKNSVDQALEFNLENEMTPKKKRNKSA